MLACVLPGPRIYCLSVYLSIYLCFCRACGRVSLSRVCVRVRVATGLVSLHVSLFLCIYAYVCMYVGIFIVDTYICTYYGYVRYVDMRYSMAPASQPASKREEKRSSCHTLRTMYVRYRAHPNAPITIINLNNNNK